MKKHILIGIGIIILFFAVYWRGDAQVLNFVRPSQIATTSKPTGYVLTISATSSHWAPATGGSGSSDAGWGTTTINGVQGTLTGGFLNFVFASGTAGSDFAITSSSGSTFTFNIPNAGASARGFVSTGDQTFAGDKTFSGGGAADALIVSATNGINITGGVNIGNQNGIRLFNGAISGSALFSLSSVSTGTLLWSDEGVKELTLSIDNLTAARTQTFQDAAGQIALVGALGIDAVSSTRAINAGTGLAGGGTLAADRTIWNALTFSTGTNPGLDITSSSPTYTFNFKGVSAITAGTNITLSSSTGNVTINSSGGGGSSPWNDYNASNTVALATTTRQVIIGPGSVATSTLTVVGSSTIRSTADSTTIPLFDLKNNAGSSTARFFATTTNNIVLQLNGHWSSTSTAPTITSGCGTSPSVDGTDVAGFLNVGGGGVASTCTLTFANQWNSNPVCFSNDTTQVLLTRAVSTTSTLVIDVAVAFGANDIIGYACLPPPR